MMRLRKRGLALLLAIGMLLGTCTDSVLAAENGSNDVVMDSSDEADNVTDQGETADDANEKADLTDSEEKTDGSDEKDTLTDTDNDADKSDETDGSENSDEIINLGETENSESGNDVEDNDADEEEPEDAKESAAVEEAEIVLAENNSDESSSVFEYTLDRYENATIKSYNGNASVLNIPETLDGYTVVKIGGSVFKKNQMLRTVVIPDSVVEIGASAFSECTNLSNVKLSYSLTTLGTHAFNNCDLITEIAIPKSLEKAYSSFKDCDGLKNVSFEEKTTEIATGLFEECTGLEEIDIPDTVTIIESSAFSGCTNLCKVTIPNSVTEIESSAFRNCSKLETIIIPDSVVEIGGSAFSECTNLSNVKLSSSLTILGSGVFYNCDLITEITIPKSLEKAYSSGPFRDCDGLKNVSFETGTTEIATCLFYDCTGIEEIEIPDTVTIIESSAFKNCTNLSKVTIPNAVTEIESGAFQNCSKLETIVIPDSVVEIGVGAFATCINLSNVILSRGLVKLNSSAFYNCDALTAIEIPKSLQSVANWFGSIDGIFGECDNLKEVTFEKGTAKIVNSLFENCPGIEEIEIPDTVTIIETSAFNNCANLCKVTIPNSVTEIKVYAFQDCSKLETITLPDSITVMGNSVFSGCSALKEATLPNGISDIENYTFKDCASLEKVNFPETIENIGNYAFYNTKLNEAVLPEKVNRIGDYAFYNCDALTKVEMQNNLTSIGKYAFNDCDALTAITIPDSVTSLGTYLFAESELLSDVTLGNGITTIPAYAFNLCPSLKKIVIPYRVTEIKGSAFTNCTTLTEITIPRSVTTIASGVFSYPSKLTVYGISGTYAETYANSIGATFVNKEVKATAVSLNKTELMLAKGVKETLILSIAPSDFTDEVVWKSTDESIVSVDDKGVVNAKSLGTATIKVTVGDLSASCKVTVAQPVTSISLNKTSLSLEALESDTLIATASPSTAENKAVVWSSSDEKIASVDENGLVTAHAKGSAVIRVEAQDGSGVYKECNVTVVNNGYLCSDANELESEHNYPVNSSDFWIYTKEGAEKLYVTFDDRTDIEEGFDYLYIYDAAGKQVGKYTGTQLAGQVVEVVGNTVKIKLVSDDSGTTWGFKVTSVSADGNVENEEEYTVTFDSQGGSTVSAVQVPKNTQVACPTAPVRNGYKFLGWYLNETLYDFSQPVTENIVLRAKWEKITDEPEVGDNEEIPEGDMPENGIIPDGLWIAGVSEQIYTGKALKPDVRVYDGRQRLKVGTDYTISYKNNVKANYDFNESSPSESSPAVIVKGKGNYAGTAKAFFKINPIDITNDPFISADDITLAYNGQSQQKEPKVTYNGKKLSAQKDYTAIYPDAGAVYGAYREVGDYTVKIEGRGNFTGSVSVRLSITDKQLIEKAKTVKIKDKAYDNGNAVTLSESELIVYMKSKNEPLTRDVDYKVSYENNCETGTAYAVITGIGDYAGVKKVKFKINGISINTAQIEGIRNKVYNGKEQGQSITVRLDGITLSEGTDYLINYTNDRIKVGTVRMTVKGIGKYTGSIKKSFKITAYDLNMDEQNMISKLPQNLTVAYSAGGAKPGVELKFGDVKLTEGTDYKISCKNNKNIADLSSDKAPTAVIKGIGNFKGSISVKFSIKKKNIADTEDALTLIAADVAYVNKAGKYISKPILMDSYGNTLKAGRDYEVTYMLSDGVTKLTEKDIVPVNTDVCLSISGKGKYEGTINTTYTIKSNSLQKAKITITPKSYTGKKVYLAKEDITVMLGNDNKLVYGVDYEIAQGSYVNNTKKGTASVVIKGKGNYAGMKTVKFKITARRMEAFDSVVRKLSGLKRLL